MARGSESKAIITNKILETFPNSFCWDKEIRIPIEENGEIIQIKCVLTAAKVNVTGGETKDSVSTSENSNPFPAGENEQLTDKEKMEVKELITKFNL